MAGAKRLKGLQRLALLIEERLRLLAGVLHTRTGDHRVRAV